MRRLRPSILPAAICAVLMLYALLVPMLNSHAIYAVDLTAVYKHPGTGHLFGTDQLGRDVWTRTAAALRVSLLMALGSATLATILGIIAATVAVTGGKLIDGIISRSIDGLNAIPHLLLSVVILALWPGQIWAIVLSIALTHWTQVARVLRSKLLAERESGYVQLTAASGASTIAIWRTHLIPAVLPQIAIAFALQVPHAMWHESALSFLGVGLPPQAASLGLLLEDARSGILAGSWWLLLFPSVVLILACWAVAGLAQHEEKARTTRRSARRHRKNARTQASQTARESHTGFTARVAVSAGADVLIDRVEINAAGGSITALMGPSGAGKTLFLRAIAGLLPATLDASTALTINGQTCVNARSGQMLGKELVFIPGSAATTLNPVRTLRKALARAFREHARDASAQNLEDYWQIFGLDSHLLDHYPHQLSGGQAQRALLALGLVSSPACIVLDEPTSALDQDTRKVIANILRRAANDGAAILMVTHDTELAEHLATVIYTMDNGQLVSSRPSVQEQGSIA